MVIATILLAACSRAVPDSTGVESLLPDGAKVLDTKPLGSATAVVAQLPVPTTSGVQPPPDAELAIVLSTPAGMRLAKAVVQQFAQAPQLAVEPVGGAPAAGMSYHTGANSQGLIVIRASAVVYDGVADSIELRDWDGDGSYEVTKSWSPFCQSHAASPRLTTIYAWQAGQYTQATARFPQAVSADVANFHAAVQRAAAPQTTPAWTPAAKACLHDALAYLADLSGDTVQAAAERAQVQQLDPAYDLDAIAKAAAGQPAVTNPT